MKNHSLLSQFPFDQHHIISIIGAGGKTTLLYQLGSELAPLGTVTLSTTTHILPPDHPLPPGVSLCTGPADEHGKLVMPALSLCQKIESENDFILYEADGSRHMPAKFDDYMEPAIRQTSDLIIQVVGLSCLGKPLSSCLHRYEQACSLYSWEKDTIMTPLILSTLVLYNFSKVPQNLTKVLVLNQTDLSSLSEQLLLSTITPFFPDIPILLTSFVEYP